MDKRWTVTAHDVLSRSELDAVVDDLARRARRYPQTRCTLALFRLATFCGLRASEVIGLRLRDLHLASTKPSLRIPAAIAKGGKTRTVPVWFGSAVADLQRWLDYRHAMDAGPSDPFLCSVRQHALGHPLSRQKARTRYQNACRVLGPDRVRGVTTHTGRHTFASMCLALGKPLAAVRDACGHSTIQVTNTYAHLWDDGSSSSYFLDQE